MRYLTLFLILIFSACSPNNNNNSSNSNLKRIISLGPAITDQLYLLNKANLIVANTTYCPTASGKKKKIKIGDLINIDTEKIYLLKPDLVLATGLTRPKTVKKLRSLNIHVERFLQPTNFNQLCSEYVRLGKMVKAGKKATKLISKIKKQVTELTLKLKNKKSKRVFLQIGAKPLYTVTKKSFINDYIKMSGAINIAADAPSGLYNNEAVIKANPEIIIIALMSNLSKQEQKKWQAIKYLKATQNNKIGVFDSYKVCSPNPLSFYQTLKKIAIFIHAE